jgi:hypothetical protein
MASSIDMTLLPASVPSLCIPRVFQNITKERVAFVFKSLDLGEIDHIDMVPRTSENGDKFQRVFIHFKRWASSDEAVRARERVLGGKEIKVIYDDPWFWKISANRSTVRVQDSSRSNDSRPKASLPRIVDDNDEGLRAAKSSSQRRRPHTGGRHKNHHPKDGATQEFTPQSPRDPPPSEAPPSETHASSEDNSGAWTKVDYGKVTEMPKPKRRAVIKKPQLKEQEPGEV